MKLGRSLVLLGSGIFAFYGMLFAIFPLKFSRLVTDSVPSSLSSIIDMRATYGGMCIAVGIIFLLLALKAETIRIGIISLLIVMVCMASTRILGIAVDGGANIVMYVYLGLEILVAALCGIALMNFANPETGP